jgi:(R,R)-butanediol dehydrogenase/meso-butanediol dehydrogenase/diacetyl reductase
MRTAIFRGAGTPLSIETVPDPTPGPRQIVIKVGRCGICGSDLTFTDPHSPAHYEAGSALGHEYAGEVVALGREVTHLAIGDRVTAIPMAGCGYCPACLSGDPIACTQCRYIMGGFGEYTIADADYAVRLPASLSLSDGALVEPLACGAQAARLAGVNAASRVLVIGVGAIGLGAIYWAHRAGCEQIVASGTSDRRSSLARQMGAAANSPRPWRSSWEALPTSSSNAAGRGA